MARLGDVGKIITGNTPKTSDPENYASDDICFVKPSDIAGETVTDLTDSEFYISEHARAKARILPPKSVLVTCIGIIGKVAINDMECAFNQQINAIIPDNSKCLTEYLAYAIQNSQAKMQDIANAPVVPIINKTQFSDIEIRLPPLSEQKKCVERLKSVSKLISLRKEQLAVLDQLVKSRFIELFGDPIDNPLNWKVSDFKDVVYFQEGPGVRNWQFRESGIKLINIRNLVDDNLVLENTSNYLSEQEVGEKYKHFLLDVGDYVMASSGVTWGKIAEIFEEHLPLCLNTSIIRLRPYDENVISKKYLFHYIKGDAFRTQIIRLITGSAQPNFGPTHLKQISILVPPIELQNQFTAFVEQTDKSKLAIQQSLDKLETLKKALMQKYFG